MKISKNTLEVLKSFTTINNGLMVHAGNRIRTQDNLTKILAYADIEDTFPQDFAVYDLAEFLSALSLVEDADLKFNPTSVDIVNDRVKLRFGFTERDYVREAPEVINYPSDDPQSIDFSITSDELNQVLKASSSLGLEEICVKTVAGDTSVYLMATDGRDIEVRSDNEAPSNDYQIKVDDVAKDAEFEFFFQADRLNIIRQDYKVSIHPGGISRFVGIGIEYFIATESK